MAFDAILLPPRRAASIAQGLWPDRTINDALDDCVSRWPDKTALSAVRAETGATVRLSYRELAGRADRIAAGLARLGVGRDDVVSCQLPNWWEFTALYLACSRLGAVLNPLMPILRERELSFMLRHAASKVVVVPRRFRGFDHEGMLEGLRASLPDLQHLLVIGGAGANAFEALLQAGDDAPAPPVHHRPGPDDITQLIYTSGTTGEPKGVLHSANTLMANIVPYAQRMRLGSGDVILMASPMAHQTGFMYGLMMPLMLGASVVLLDTWEPRRALELIRGEGVSFTMASTPFLSDLARAVADTGLAIPTLRTFLCAGAPIPGALVEQARAALGAKVVSAWGMTEMGAVTTTRLDDDDERAVNTDGCPLPGVAVRVVDAAGTEQPAGATGRLLVRSCSNFGGYLRRPHLNDTDADGWFDTGDLARIDAHGFIRIDGRSKDVIIRGGENIPVVEVEALLYRHPAVSQVAIVAYPDERLGERACAFVVTRPGCAFDMAAMAAYLKAHKLTQQYVPERLVVREALPCTPAGKIQKFRLREELRG
ncbi:cyclohexanecarboxylate-CoA ligase [Cupriavidus sp. 2TAF22]|uniref:cyclohexanecarboxylate-CoA ligase n=1 Tax=unclassified Cupriavidus TaxID=2640874 RepID=UPI003F8F26BB